MIKLFLFVSGIIGLWVGTKWVVKSAIGIAEKHHLSHAFVGLAILGVGTDLPEVFVTIDASIFQLRGIESSGIITGNAIGSSICQISMILGIAGFFHNFTLSKKELFRDGLALLASIGLVFVIGWDGVVSRADGLVLLAAYLIYYVVLWRTNRKVTTEQVTHEHQRNLKLAGYLLIGFVALVFSSHLVVKNAMFFAEKWGVAQSFVGIVLIGLGTSLPELAVSTGAALRKSGEMSVGNIMGSNIFDTLVPVGLGGSISQILMENNLLKTVDGSPQAGDGSKEVETPPLLAPHVSNLTPEDGLLLAMSLNHDVTKDESGELVGESTEVALSVFGEANLTALQPADYPRVGELPFDSVRKMMTTVHRRSDGKFLVIAKGALEAVLEACADDTDKTAMTAAAEKMAENGLRVLAYGYRILDELPAERDFSSLETRLQCLGIAGMIDPPREEATQAIADCLAAGIVPVMITGDHPATATAIARQIGILTSPDDKTITGAALQKLSEQEFKDKIERIKVYARVSPEQKLQIVKALQSKGQFVAMTGDGVNDAPALRRANIGVAMGITGTDVSKEAAHMILLDDNFATIVKAVREGRRIFENIRKFIKYILTGNSGEIWTIFLAPLAGLPIPLLPIQILWVNLVTDGFPALALAGEPAEKNIMQLPPRKPGESIFAHGLGWHVLWVGLLIGAICLGVQAWAMHHNDPKWQTYVFTVLCFSQMTHVLAIRSEHFFLFRQGIFGNLPLIGAVLFTFVMQLALLYVPFLQKIFSTQALTLAELGGCIAVSLIVFHAVEMEKLVRKWRNNK